VVPAIDVAHLTFAYPGADTPVLRDLTVSIPAGARCLLLGANGVGKSTLLRVVAGRHKLPPDVVRVLGRPAFEDTTLAADVAFMGGAFPFAADIRVRDMLVGRPGIDPRRRARVLEILDVDPAWRMHRVSDGQRRRVQILLDLERTLRVALLDEVTAELDVLARADLLAFLREESEASGLTVVYASHVFDGLGAFASHVAFLSPGRLRWFSDIQALSAAHGLPLRELAEKWMREDRTRATTIR
jgi:CCR4-NOT complex subunit CAF16